MTTEVVCALIATVGAITSAVISWFVSRYSANKEVEKMKLLWKREDVISSDEEFAEMSSAVARCLQSSSKRHRIDAMAKVAAIRSKELGEMAARLDSLYNALNSDSDLNINEELTKVIDEKRNAKRKTKATCRNTPN